MSEASYHQAPSPTHEADIAPPELTVFSPDQDLAFAHLGRKVDEAGANPQTDPTHLELFKLQFEIARAIPSGEPGHDTSASAHIETWQEDFKRRNPMGVIKDGDTNVGYELRRGTVVGRAARAERWRIVGVDPKSVEFRVREDQERKWSSAARAEQARVQAEQEAQAKRELAETALQEIMGPQPTS